MSLDFDGAEDGFPLGLDDNLRTGLSLGSMLNNGGPELGAELGGTAGGALLGD